MQRILKNLVQTFFYFRKVALALLLAWLLTFLALIKGVSSLGKVSYVTAIFPYFVIIALIIRGVTLDGAMVGIEYYILRVDWDKFLTAQMWIDATTQVIQTPV
jgi:SNF family Na+-dependent transporter